MTPARCVTVLVGLLGVGLLLLAFTDPFGRPQPPVARGDDAAPSPGPSPGASAIGRPAPSGHGGQLRNSRAGTQDLVTGPVLPQAPPVSVSVPRLHMGSRLVRLGLDGGGAMEVPRDPALAGWYDRGPAPGALGPAVIAGHVTWNQAPAVFFRLAAMRDGDVVEVSRQDGRVAVFRVTRVARFDKAHFPTRAVFGAVDHAGLRLITCGGYFDESRRRYRDNVVVFATLVSSHRTR